MNSRLAVDNTVLVNKDIALRVAAKAARHHGAFTRDQAIAAGASGVLINRQVEKGLWERPVPSVYVVRGSPASWQRAVVVAVYGSGPGAIASHATAAHIWGIANRPRKIEVTSPNGWRPPRDHVIHRSTDLIAEDITEVDGIPVATVPRCLVDIGVPWGEGLASVASMKPCGVGSHLRGQWQPSSTGWPDGVGMELVP